MLKNLIFLSAGLVILYFFSGCSTPQVVYKEVKVPIKCDVSARKKPAKNANTILYLKELLVYVEGLERDLSYCKGEK